MPSGSYQDHLSPFQGLESASKLMSCLESGAEASLQVDRKEDFTCPKEALNSGQGGKRPVAALGNSLFGDQRLRSLAAWPLVCTESLWRKL
jgi:hypothetical protein